MTTFARRSTLGAVLVAGTALVTACGAQPAPDAATPVSEAAATESAAVTPDELGDALLPAAAFGSDATVVGLSLEKVGDLPALGGMPQGATFDPPVCGAAMAMMGSSAADLPTLVAEGAYTSAVQSLEVLADGPALDGLALPVDQLLASCPTVTVTAPDGTVTTIDLAELDVPALGDASAGLQVTVTGPEESHAALVGVVSQGSRALVLAQTGEAPDAAAFTDLLTQAADAAGA